MIPWFWPQSDHSFEARSYVIFTAMPVRMAPLGVDWSRIRWKVWCRQTEVISTRGRSQITLCDFPDFLPHYISLLDGTLENRRFSPQFFLKLWFWSHSVENNLIWKIYMLQVFWYQIKSCKDIILFSILIPYFVHTYW